MTWNSTFKNPGKPLQRKAPIGRAKPALSSPSSTPMKRNPMKRFGRRKHKIEGHHDQKMLDACRGEPCYLRVPGLCALDPKDPTVVDCHGNWADTGKGMGLKAADRFSVPGCGPCHYWLDFGTTASREEKRAVFFDALRRWGPVRERKLNAKPAANGRQKETATSSGLQSLGGR